MRNYFYLLLIPIALLWACKEEPAPPVDPPVVVGKITLQSTEPVVLSDEGDSKQVVFTATLAWTAAAGQGQEWMTVNPRSGEAGEDIVLTVRAGANQDYDPRTGSITLTCGEDSKTVQVTQKQKGESSISKFKLQS